jgi:hypothetical protein
MPRVAKIELKTEDLLKALAPYLGETLPKDAKVYHVHFSPGLAEVKLLVESGEYPETLGGDTFHYAKPVTFNPGVRVKVRETNFGDSGSARDQGEPSGDGSIEPPPPPQTQEELDEISKTEAAAHAARTKKGARISAA